MTPVATMLRSLPRPYASTPSSVIAQFLDVLSLELEIAQEDVGRVRLTHWIEQAYASRDVVRLAALVGVAPLPWETADTFRARLVPLVAGRLRGSVGPLEIARFVFEYLRAAEAALGRPSERLPAVLVPGLQRVEDAPAAFAAQPERPRFRPLALVENPRRAQQSRALEGAGGRVAHLQHWTDRNGGLFDAVPRIVLVGAPGGRSTVPLIVNRTTREWIGYRGVVPVGRRLAIEAPDAERGAAVATLDGIDVSDRLIGSASFPPDPALRPGEPAAAPRVPTMRRGDNEWMYLSAGLFGVRGVDRTFLAFADETMAEASFDAAAFDHAIFPVGPAATLEMTWVEHEPASFEVRVPHGMTVEPAGRSPLADAVAAALAASIAELRAAGVAAALVLIPFIETQEHRSTVVLPWVALPAEAGPTGSEAGFTVGGRFGDTAFGGTRFE